MTSLDPLQAVLMSTPPGADLPASAQVLAPPPVLFAGALAGGLVLRAVRPFPLTVPWRAPLGALSVAGAGVLAASAIRTLRRAGTTVDPGGASTALITGGPYAYTRNPIYVAFGGLGVGVALLSANAWQFLTFGSALAVVRIGVIAREERYLHRIFGTDYERYTTRVRRWF